MSYAIAGCQLVRQAMRMRFALALVLSVGLLAATAEAASASYTWDPRGVSFLFASPGVITGTTVNNNTTVTMQCWTDAGSYTGAYTSNRWFRVRIVAWNYVTWMHSSNVYAQTSVAHC
jgi:hypothetical protein